MSSICNKLRPNKQMDIPESTTTDDAAESASDKTSECETRSPRSDSVQSVSKSPQDTSNTQESGDGLSRRPSADVKESNPFLNLSGGLRGVRRSSMPHTYSSLQPEGAIWKPYIPRKPSPNSSSYKPSRPNPETYIKIVEQPASNASRFRYECEGRTAGSMIGVRSTPDRKTYPAVKLVGYEGPGKPYVVVSCVTKDYPHKPHPHNLVGTDCVYGVCKTYIENGRTKTFSNIGIQCVKKKDFEKALILRERNKIDPFKTGFDHKSDRSTIELNAVRLCFQAFVESQGAITPPVASDVILDKKFSGVLNICKLSKYSASVEGGEEVILLCKKICKDDIKVYMYEMQDEKLVWQDEAQLTPELIHEQSAIPFFTPKYKNLNISNPVQVFIQLFRPSDRAVSDPKPFQLLPIKPPDLKLNLEISQTKLKKESLPDSTEQIDGQPLANRLPDVLPNTNQRPNPLPTNRFSENLPPNYVNGQPKIQSLLQSHLQPKRMPNANQQSYIIRQPDNLPQYKNKFLNLLQPNRQTELKLHNNPQPEAILHSNQPYCIVSYARPSDDIPNVNPLHFNLPNATWQPEPLLHSTSQPGVITHSNQKIHTLPFTIQQSEALPQTKVNHWTLLQNSRQPEPLLQAHCSQPEDISHVEQQSRVLWKVNQEVEHIPYTSRERRSLPHANKQRCNLPYVFRQSARLPYDEEQISVHLHSNERFSHMMHANPQPEDLSYSNSQPQVVTYANSQPRDLKYDIQQPDDRLHTEHERTWTLLTADQHPGPPPAHSQSGAMSYALLEANHQRWALPYASRQCGDFVRIGEDYLAHVQDDRQHRLMPHFSQQPRHEIHQRCPLPYFIRQTRSPPQGNP